MAKGFDLTGLVTISLSVGWILYWSGKFNKYKFEKHPKTFEYTKMYKSVKGIPIKDTTAGALGLLKNFHPNDKTYTHYLNMVRLGYLLFILAVIYNGIRIN